MSSIMQQGDICSISRIRFCCIFSFVCFVSLSVCLWQEPVLAIWRGISEVLNCQVMGSGKNQFLPFEEGSQSGWNVKLWGVARTGSCHLKRGLRGAEMWSYGEWQEPVLATLLFDMFVIVHWQELVLAILHLCRHRADICSNWEWQELVLAIFKVCRHTADICSYGEWQGLLPATWSVRKVWEVARTGSCHLNFLETGIKWEVMVSGKNQFLPLEVLGSYWEWQELVLATFSLICGSIYIGKNWFLPFKKCLKEVKRWRCVEWQELVLAIF